jgi:ubiquitin carboxyl-terminal hydrolase 7
MYDSLLNRVMIKFAPKNEGPYKEFWLPLNKKLTYVDFARAVGEHLGEKPDYLRFYTVNQQSGKPKNVVRHNANNNLGQILNPSYAPYGAHVRPDAMYYEVLECSLTELEQRRVIKITWLPDGQNKEVSPALIYLECSTDKL